MEETEQAVPRIRRSPSRIDVYEGLMAKHKWVASPLLVLGCYEQDFFIYSKPKEGESLKKFKPKLLRIEVDNYTQCFAYNNTAKNYIVRLRTAELEIQELDCELSSATDLILSWVVR